MLTLVFTAAKIQKQLQCSSIDEQIKKICYTDTHTHTHNGIIAIKKNEILPFETTRTELESIMLSEISQTKTNTASVSDSLMRGI